MSALAKVYVAILVPTNIFLSWMGYLHLQAIPKDIDQWPLAVFFFIGLNLYALVIYLGFVLLQKAFET